MGNFWFLSSRISRRNSSGVTTNAWSVLSSPLGNTNRILIGGAFKVPSLRNVKLTAPYFHNGGQATIRQVVEFYNRGGDFREHNSRNIDSRLASWTWPMRRSTIWSRFWPTRSRMNASSSTRLRSIIRRSSQRRNSAPRFPAIVASAFYRAGDGGRLFWLFLRSLSSFGFIWSVVLSKECRECLSSANACHGIKQEFAGWKISCSRYFANVHNNSR